MIRRLKPTQWTMLNGSLSTAIISPRRRWICQALGWSNAYGFPLSNTWAIVGCFLLPLALVYDCSFSTFWRAMYCSGCFVITCLWRLYDFVLVPPLETLSSQTLQQALLTSAAFTTKYSKIPLVIHLAIVSHRIVNMCSLVQIHVIPWSVLRVADTRYLTTVPVSVPIPILIPVSVEHYWKWQSY